MSTLIGALAALAAAGMTFPLGWWLGGRRKAAELRRYQSALDQAHALIYERHRQHRAVVGEVVHASLNALRAQKGQA